MKYILGSDSLTVFFKGNPYTINKEAHNYGLVLKAIQDKDDVALDNALHIKQGLVKSLQKSSSSVHIDGNKIMYADREVTGLIASRIFEVIRLGLDVKPMVTFLENLMSNPSKRAVDELFGFLDACKLPITEDGHFLAYKRVRADYKDCHSGTMDNSVGKIVEMERNQVNDDKEITCSHGLHACSYSYLQHFGGARIVVVKINPADVVSVPVDYNNAKLRCCKYEVVDEIPLNEYNMPSYELDEGYTGKYSNEEDGGEELDIESTEVKPMVNSSAKLTEKEVSEIKQALKDKISVSSIASWYNISERQVRRIRDSEAWGWVK